MITPGIAALLACLSAGEDPWPARGGAQGNFRLDQAEELTDTFGDWGPRILWRQPLGGGYSGLLFEDGRLFAQSRGEEGEVVRCLRASDGEVLWERRYGAEVYPDMDRGYGDGPNATPLLHEERLFAVSIDGRLRALDSTTGEILWSLDLHERYGRQERREEYGFSASPIVVDGHLVVLVGGDVHGAVALDPEDGSQVWGSPPSRVSYAQVTRVDLEEGPQLLFFSPEAVIGMDARTGEFRWEYPVENMFQNNLTPALYLGDRHVWVASQLDAGSRVLRIPDPGSKDGPQVLWESKRIKQAHWDSFCIGDFVYGSLGGNSGSFLAAVHWRTGEVAWKHRGFHLAKGVLADGKFIFLDENGQLGIARFSPNGIDVLDSGQVTERVSWTPPTLVGQVLFARDRESVLAVDLSPSSYEE